MPFHLRITTGFTRRTLEWFLDAHVNDDFMIAEGMDTARGLDRQPVVLAFANSKDRDLIQSLLGVRGHRLAPRSMRVEHYSAVA